MDVNKVINRLKKKYPRKTIIKNDEINPTEIICELDPSKKHPDYGIAISIIDQSLAHYHKKTTEVYEVLNGKIILKLNNKEFILEKGSRIVIKPNIIHSAKGNETWIKVYSKPGWTVEDHILVE